MRRQIEVDLMPRIAYLSRGNGYGHAAKDHLIIRSLRKLSDADIVVASSGAGMDYYRMHGWEVTDLQVPDELDHCRASAGSILAFLHGRQPLDLVVADELFYTPEIAAMLNVPCIILTHWFFEEVGSPSLDTMLNPAASIVILDFAAAHCRSSQLEASLPVHYTGALAEPFCMDRLSARSSLSIGADELITVVTVGAIIARKRCLVRKVLCGAIDAWRHAGAEAGRLVILADRSDHLPTGFDDRAVEWVGVSREPETYLAAADQVITCATFTTMSTLVRNAVPTVAIVGHENPVDTLHASFFDEKNLLVAIGEDFDPLDLWDGLSRMRHVRQTLATSSELLSWGSPDDVAAIILAYST